MDETKFKLGVHTLKKASIGSGGLVICYPGGANCLVISAKGDPDPFVEPTIKQAFQDDSLSSATKEINRLLREARDQREGDDCLSILVTDRGFVLAWVTCVDDLDDSKSGALADALGLPPRP